MENQHRKITGYRELSEDEIELMNLVKEHAELTKQVLHKVISKYEYECPLGQNTPEDQYSEMKRCHTLAKTNLQQGYMWLVRAIARPESF